VLAGLEEEGGPPALKAAAADPRGAFTAAEVGEEDEECSPTCKAAAADPTGTFTAATAEAGGSEEPELVAGNAFANVGGAGGAKVEAGTAITGDTIGDSCEEGVEEEDEPVVDELVLCRIHQKSMMAEKIDAKNREFDVGQQKGPLEEATAEG
jgi:hypothetical protein